MTNIIGFFMPLKRHGSPAIFDSNEIASFIYLDLKNTLNEKGVFMLKKHSLKTIFSTCHLRSKSTN